MKGTCFAAAGTPATADTIITAASERARRVSVLLFLICALLLHWSGGDPAALDRLAERVHPELRQMARRYMKNEREVNTPQSTALVHEVYLRLVDVGNVAWRERAPFYAMAAQMTTRSQ